jgi:MarR family transcriptional regulator, transcriptional regulator for hemolysin
LRPQLSGVTLLYEMETTAQVTSPAMGSAVECDPALIGNLKWLLAQTYHALSTELMMRLEGMGVAPRNFWVLSTALRGGLTQSEIAKRIGMDKTTMVVAGDELERDGLAVRKPSETDRRARVIEVTAKGAAKVEQAEAIMDEVQADVLASLPEAEAEALMSALGKLVTGRLSQTSPCENSVRRPRG